MSANDYVGFNPTEGFKVKRVRYTQEGRPSDVIGRPSEVSGRPSDVSMTSSDRVSDSGVNNFDRQREFNDSRISESSDICINPSKKKRRWSGDSDLSN